MNEKYSIKELLDNKEKIELEVYKMLRGFQLDFECNVNIELVTEKDDKGICNIKDVILHIGV